MKSGSFAFKTWGETLSARVEFNRLRDDRLQMAAFTKAGGNFNLFVWFPTATRFLSSFLLFFSSSHRCTVLRLLDDQQQTGYFLPTYARILDVSVCTLRSSVLVDSLPMADTGTILTILILHPQMKKQKTLIDPWLKSKTTLSVFCCSSSCLLGRPHFLICFFIPPRNRKKSELIIFCIKETVFIPSSLYVQFLTTVSWYFFALQTCSLVYITIGDDFRYFSSIFLHFDRSVTNSAGALSLFLFVYLSFL